MAVTTVIAAKTAAVALTDTSSRFTAAGPFVLSGDNFAVGEFAMLYRLGPSGVYKPYTDRNGVVIVSAYPNTVPVNSAGSFQVVKTATAAAASVAFELQVQSTVAYSAPTIPALNSATIGTLGLFIDLVFSVALTIGANGSAGWTLVGETSGPIAMTYSSGDTTTGFAYSLATPPPAGEAFTLSYFQPVNGLESATGVDLPNITDFAVTNNSEVT